MHIEDNIFEKSRPKESEPREYLKVFSDYLVYLQPLIAKNFSGAVTVPLQKLLEMDIDRDNPEYFDRTETVRLMKIAHNLLNEKDVPIEIPEKIRKFFEEKAEGI